ncbi:MAG: hypothetical protein GX564_04130 [Oligosphaeraceae bacterium]|nr:hypothetical protein [Oligosphaeraceae bacterium]
MRITHLPLLLALTATLAVLAQDLPTAQAVRQNGPVQIDGQLREAAWQSAPLQKGVLPLGKREPPQDTEFRLLFDDESLTIGITCWEKEMDKLGARTSIRDHGGVCSDDSVELFLVPGNGYYYQIAVNTLGYVYDGRSFTDPERQRASSRGPLLWDNASEIAVWRGPDRWSVEIRVFYASLDGYLGFNTPWRLNVCRTESRFGYACWAPVQKGYHDLASFGYLQGLELPRDRFTLDSTKLEFPEILLGTNQVKLQLPAQRDGQKFRVLSSLRNWVPGPLPQRNAHPGEFVSRAGQLTIEFEFNVRDHEPMQELVLECQDVQSGEKVLLATYLFRVPKPFAVTPRWTVFFASEKEVLLDNIIRVSPLSARGTLRVEVFGASQTVPQLQLSHAVEKPGPMQLGLPLSALGWDGCYRAVLTLDCDGGKAQFNQEVSFFKISAPLY